MATPPAQRVTDISNNPALPDCLSPPPAGTRQTRDCTGPVSTDEESPLTRQGVVHEMSAFAGAALAGTGALTMSESADALATSLAPAGANAEAGDLFP